ncbi:hypothetical protein PORY_000528 [Pneumocystis oryctolagi]|uniref:Uncharacterized protein n=1 Tax=Pneumocystis oryctolagi TaxID=42067 RepID=A0ACB7CGF0_9ASCO|nr:hypothetical protein PORY_000528 [Pneumocystis oryctolagi]
MNTFQNSLYTYNVNDSSLNTYDSKKETQNNFQFPVTSNSDYVHKELKRLHLNSKKELFKKTIPKTPSEIEIDSTSDNFSSVKNSDKSLYEYPNKLGRVDISLSSNDFETNNLSKAQLLQKKLKFQNDSQDSDSLLSIVDCYSTEDNYKDSFIEETGVSKEYLPKIRDSKCNISCTVLKGFHKSSIISSPKDHSSFSTQSYLRSLKSSINSNISSEKLHDSKLFQLYKDTNSFSQTVTSSSNKISIGDQLESVDLSLTKSIKYHTPKTFGLNSKIMLPTEFDCTKKMYRSSSNIKNDNSKSSFIGSIPTKLPISQKKNISNDIIFTTSLPKNISDYRKSKIQILKNKNKLSSNLKNIEKNINGNFLYTLSKKTALNTKSEKYYQDKSETINLSPLNVSVLPISVTKKDDFSVLSKNNEKNISKPSPKSSPALSKLCLKKNIKNSCFTHTEIPVYHQEPELYFSKDSSCLKYNRNIYHEQSNLYDVKNINFSKNVLKKNSSKSNSNYKHLEKTKIETDNVNFSKSNLSKITPISGSLHKIFETSPKKNILYSNEELYYSSKLNSTLDPLYNIKSNMSVEKLKSSFTKLCIDDFDNNIIKDEFYRLSFKRQKFEKNRKFLNLYDDKKIKLEKKEKPINFNDIKSYHYSSLTLYEIGEINNYIGSIYFIGHPEIKKKDFSIHFYDNNNPGYDDDRGDYIVVIGDHIAYRYEVCSILGKGSFGQVVKCFDHKMGKVVAIKIIRNKKKFHIQALIEVKILRQLSKWDPNDDYSFIKYIDHFYFREHLCIVMELLNLNLYELIKINDFKGFSLSMIRWFGIIVEKGYILTSFSFTKQLLQDLVFLKKHQVIHCDLKPENILLCSESEPNIKIIDFGSSCFENEKIYTYIQSRFYRSPEIILGLDYGIPIDIWSLGCILAELYTGHPIFPGQDEHEQLACIMEVLGLPDTSLIEKSPRKNVFFDYSGNPRIIVFSKGKQRLPSSKTLSQVVKCDDIFFLDFLSKCFLWNPEHRLTPEEALKHEFITKHKII